jgi:hypothetical protein
MPDYSGKPVFFFLEQKEFAQDVLTCFLCVFTETGLCKVANILYFTEVFLCLIRIGSLFLGQNSAQPVLYSCLTAS